MFIAIILLFVFGLVVGSFLNVVIFRYQPNKFLFNRKVLSGRSRCPECGRKLRWYELIPLFSFLIQLGRCRSCRVKISWQYPIVEFLSGLVLLLPIYFYYHLQISQHILSGNVLVWYYWLSGAWVLVGLLMIILSVIDWRTYLIPDEAVIGIGLLGLLISSLKFFYEDLLLWKVSFLGYYANLISFPLNLFWQSIIIGIIGFLFFGLIFVLTKGRGMGFGDVKLAGALGILLGWPDAILSFALSFVIGSAGGLLLIFLGRKKFRQPIPFGPYMAASVFVVVFFGFSIVDWYFSLFPVL